MEAYFKQRMAKKFALLFLNKMCFIPLWQHGTPFPHESPSLWMSGSGLGWHFLYNRGQQSHRRQRWGQSSAQKSHSPPGHDNIQESTKIQVKWTQIKSVSFQNSDINRTICIEKSTIQKPKMNTSKVLFYKWIKTLLRHTHTHTKKNFLPFYIFKNKQTKNILYDL